MKRLVAGLLLAALCPAGDRITGAGATFPAPLYAKWLDVFQSSHPGAAISYEAVGSGEGLKRLKAGAVDFAASDIPVSDADLVTIPTVVGAVVPVYNLPGVTGDLRFTRETLAGIFLGKITRWDDPAIKAANKKLALPGAGIVVVHRGDASGTTFIWSNFLFQSTEVQWPVGLAANGNEGVARKVHDTPNAIGYAEFIYALRDRVSYAAVSNVAGHFIQPGTESIRAAAADPAAANAYPVTAVTWFVLPRHIEAGKRARLLEFMNWMLDRGQNQAAALGFIPLSNGQLAKAHESLTTLP